jgi:hypothetical protein
MALFVKNAVFFNSGYLASASSGILAGMVVALQTNSTTGEPELIKASRTTAGTEFGAFIAGIAGDDATNSGNTIAPIDPVYQIPYMRPARRLGDYLDETITNRTNWTDSGTSKRGVTVFSVGGEFMTDQYVTTTSASGANADAGAAPAYAINDGWTFAVVANAGKFVDDGGQAITTLRNMARLTGSVSNSLLPFRWVFSGV